MFHKLLALIGHLNRKAEVRPFDLKKKKESPSADSLSTMDHIIIKQIANRIVIPSPGALDIYLYAFLFLLLIVITLPIFCH